jgi:hypothetical protein
MTQRKQMMTLRQEGDPPGLPEGPGGYLRAAGGRPGRPAVRYNTNFAMLLTLRKHLRPGPETRPTQV